MGNEYTQEIRLIEKSIMKWNDICMGYGVNLGCTNCALCEKYHGWNCMGCPVSERTGKVQCYETPYYDALPCRTLPFEEQSVYLKKANKSLRTSFGFRRSQWEKYYKRIEGSEAMLIFLLKLLPEYHPWREQI